jgi:putative transposase
MPLGVPQRIGKIEALALREFALKPTREHATNNSQTYFVTAATWQRRALFRNRRWADLFMNVLHSYRGRGYLLHDYVLMPDHFHVLVTPDTTLERAVQFIKGGFSFRAKRNLGSSMEIWQRGFSDHRIRDWNDFKIHVGYINRNPVGRGLAESAEEYPYCSAFPGSLKDELPQWLKPHVEQTGFGTAEAVPFQSRASEIIEGILRRGDER